MANGAGTGSRQDVTERESPEYQPDSPAEALETATPAEESTVGVGTTFAVGCSLIILLITLGGVCYFIAQRVT